MTFLFAFVFVFSCTWLFITSVVAKNKAPSNSVPLKLVNNAGSPIELFWVDIYSNIGPKEETFTVYFDPVTATLNVTLTTKLSEIVDTINQATTKCQKLSGTSEFSSCIAAGIIDDVNYITEAKTTMASYRDLMSAKLRNYTCADDTLNTTEPISSYQIAVEDNEYKVDILLNMTHAKIWKVDNFITPEECSVLEDHGRSRLTRATVAAEDGSRNLFQRVLNLTNYHAGMNLQPPGQEDFTIIQYNVEDQYLNHCDGTCDDSIHIPRGRVATAVLYCKVPEKGGATSFTKADIFVKPKFGMATFFSYKGLDGRMDDGYTEHSGCPVLEGEKWITVVWMRDGVDEQHPWTMYDPNGVKMLD